ncbi:MAG: chloride channel protein [Sulfolobaceae archaeon]|nr:chloride channel protein [Sulfolobaceae archaeon]
MRRRISELPYFERWFIIASILGVVLGLVTVAFYELLSIFTDLFINDIIGMSFPLPIGEGGTLSFVFHASRYYLIPVVTALGGLITGLIVYTLAPEAAGSGIDDSIRAFHYRQGNIRWIVSPIKIVASAITLGSGGSGGDEGPAAQYSASLGSTVLNLLGLPPEDRRRAAAVGIGAGIGIIFKTPIGGSLLASEILYKRDLEPDVIYPALITSAIGYTIFGLFTGFQPIFGYYLVPFNPLRLPMYAVIGVVTGLLAILYVKSLEGTEELFKKMKGVPNYLKPAIGGAIAGLIALIAPEVLSTGEGWINLLEYGKFSSFYSPILPIIALLVLLPFLKIIATSFTVSSGGSAGVFIPGLFIGAFVGGDLGLIFHHFFPNIASSIAPFIIIGMVSFFAAAGKVPLSVLIMVTEMTGSLQLLPGAMIAVAISYLVSGNYTIYPAQLNTRRESPAHKSEYEIPVLDRIKVSSCELKKLMLRLNDTVENAKKLMEDNLVMSLPVVNDNMEFIGIVYFRDIEKANPNDPIAKYITVGTPYVTPSSNLLHAIDVMNYYRTRWVAVVEGCKPKCKFLGVLTLEAIDEAYKRELKTLRS